jgi:hypothetical protein
MLCVCVRGLELCFVKPYLAQVFHDLSLFVRTPTLSTYARPVWPTTLPAKQMLLGLQGHTSVVSTTPRVPLCVVDLSVSLTSAHFDFLHFFLSEKKTFSLVFGSL